MTLIKFETNFDYPYMETFMSSFRSGLYNGITSAGGMIKSNMPEADVVTLVTGDEGLISVKIKGMPEAREATIDEYTCTIHLYRGGTVTINIPEPPISYIDWDIWHQAVAIIVRTVLETIRRSYM